jgi:hypothetical protein
MKHNINSGIYIFSMGINKYLSPLLKSTLGVKNHSSVFLLDVGKIPGFLMLKQEVTRSKTKNKENHDSHSKGLKSNYQLIVHFD